LLTPDLHGERRAGYLISVRNVALHVARLDDIDGDLVVEASRLGGDGTTVLYRFSLSGGNRVLLTGRAAILINLPESTTGFSEDSS
jgi:predicted hotdog family 3-hydroxylacyl-ACP dehydratase